MDSGAPLSKGTVYAPSRTTRTPQAGELIDNWQQIFTDTFESTFPTTPPCTLQDLSNDGFDRKWGKDSLHVFSGNSAIWPARGGTHGVNPATNYYPANMDSSLICGPFDITNYQTIMTRFIRWMDIDDPLDRFWWGYSTDGTVFNWFYWTGVKKYWVDQSIYIELPSGKSQIWIALSFTSDGNNTPTSSGVWIDNLEMWRYKPTVACVDLDRGNKGIHFAAYEKSVGGLWYPIIRAGEMNALIGLMQADARWVRLPFIIPRDPPPNDVPPWSTVSPEHYDRMVDSLCNAGISVTGLVNHETLIRPLSEADYDTTAASYRQEFAGQATWLAYHFRTRIKYWEIWNEPRHTAPLNASHYAALLTQTSNSIKANNPNAKVLFAGLEHAWNFYNNYFLEVYNRLDDEQGHARPFDIFAIHPYPDDNYGKDPQWYMHVVTETLTGNKTIIDKFVTTMELKGDTSKRVWVSEVGWNSALGSPNADSMSVDKIAQALYLQQSFDILLREARSVDKVFWFKYMDQDEPMSASTFNRILNGEHWRMRLPGGGLFDPASPLVDVPSYWGLYTLNWLVPKPSQCAFKFYPQRCPDLPSPVFLPLIRRAQ